MSSAEKAVRQFLNEATGPVTLAQIASQLGIRSSVIADVIRKLAARGLIAGSPALATAEQVASSQQVVTTMEILETPIPIKHE